jgi:hypothetical protein
MKEYLRIDYFFSYWIILWFIIYYFIVKINIFQTNSKNISIIQKNYNPKLALYIALFENLFMFIYLLFHNPTITTIIKFIIMMIVLKVIPLYLLQEEKIILPEDLLPVFVLFIIYNKYLESINKSLYSIYKSSAQHILNGSNQTPFFHLLDSIGSRFFGKSS